MSLTLPYRLHKALVVGGLKRLFRKTNNWCLWLVKAHFMQYTRLIQIVGR